jgi:hypothetical protein
VAAEVRRRSSKVARDHIGCHAFMSPFCRWRFGRRLCFPFSSEFLKSERAKRLRRQE